MATSSWHPQPKAGSEESSDGFAHVTVMREAAVQAIAQAPFWAQGQAPEAIQWVVDCTLGGGGHAEALLEALPAAHLLGFDRDLAALAAATERLKRFGARVHTVHAPFAELAAHCERLGIQQVHGIVADLGVSSHQFDTAERGFSFRMDGPLDMRMDPSRGPTALELLGEARLEDLADVLYAYGDIRRSIGTARILLEEVGKGAVTTAVLAERLAARLGRQRSLHPATQVFQALRIWVNGELDQLELLLQQAPALLTPGAALAIISFHSGEDRLVKHRFAELAKRGGEFSLPQRKPQVAEDEELRVNPRARSAKLRVLQRRIPADEPQGEEEDCEDLDEEWAKDGEIDS